MGNDSKRHLFFALVLILAVGGSVGAQEDYLTVEKSQWNVAVAILDIEDGDSAGTVLRSMASLVPRIILDGLGGAGTHRLSAGEREFLADELVEDRRETTIDTLAGLHDKRDRMFFDPNTDPEEVESVEDSIREQNRSLADLGNWPMDRIAVPETLPVVFSGDDKDGEFIPAVTVDPQLLLAGSDLDVIIHGNIVKVGGYYGLKIEAAVPGRTDVLWEGAVDEDGIEEAAGEAAGNALELVLGRSWSAVNIQVSPPEATITVSGQVVGVGYWAESTLEPGLVTMEVTAPGYTPRVQAVTLPENAILDMELVLESTDHPSVLVRSQPPGADVRLGSIWLGLTPLAIQLPDRVMSLHFEKEGYLKQTVPFYPDSPALTVPLENLIVDPALELETAQKKLHTAIALFSFSLAPTIILAGVNRNYYNMKVTATDPADIAFAQKADQVTWVCMWGSAALNAGLLTNVFFKLSRYLKAAEGLDK